MSFARHTAICVWLVFQAIGAGIAWSADSTPALLAHPEHIPEIEKRIWQSSCHSGPVVVSPNGRWLAGGSSDGTVRIWDAATGRELRRLEGHDGWVTSVSFSPDGKWLASGSHDETVRVWNLTNGREHLRLDGHRPIVTSVSFSPDGRWLASAAGDGTIRLWDAATGKIQRRLQAHNQRVEAIALSPDGKWLAGVLDDETVRVWDVATGEELRRLDGFVGAANTILFAPAADSKGADGWPRLFVGCDDGAIVEWTLRPSQFIRGMITGRRGCWATWNAAGEVVRFDDGTLIPDEPDMAGVATSQLELATPLQTIIASYPGQASFPVTVRNLGKAPIYWPRLDAAVTQAQQERKFNVFICEPRALPATPDAKDEEDTLAVMPLELASDATRTFSLSLTDEAIRRLRESPDTAQWSVSIDQYDPALHCWISPPTPIRP